MLRAILFSVFITINSPLTAVFHLAQQWVSPDGTQTVLTLSDLHKLLSDNEEKHALQQQQDLLAAMKKLRSKRLIVEDLHSFALEKVIGEGDGDHPPLRYGSPLDFLVHTAHKEQIDCVNVECRFSLLSYADRVFSDTIDYTTVCRDTTSVINEIKKYDDGSVLNNLYHAAAHRCATMLKILPVDYTSKQIVDFGLLVDAQILHTLRHSNTIEHVVIAAGGRHIRVVNAYLAKRGYIKKRQAGVLASDVRLTHDPIQDARYALNISALSEKIISQE